MSHTTQRSPDGWAEIIVFIAIGVSFFTSCNGIGNCNGSPGGGSGNSGGGDSSAFVQHPTTQQIAYTQVDDSCSGHWAFSFPPRCLSN